MKKMKKSADAMSPTAVEISSLMTGEPLACPECYKSIARTTIHCPRCRLDIQNYEDTHCPECEAAHGKLAVYCEECGAEFDD